jgi:hypothetical protein
MYAPSCDMVPNVIDSCCEGKCCGRVGANTALARLKKRTFPIGYFVLAYQILQCVHRSQHVFFTFTSRHSHRTDPLHTLYYFV